MAIQRKSTEPAGVTNASGEPEIVLEIEGLTLTMSPPRTTPAPAPTTAADETGDRR